jgi:hypothetical protein
MMRLLVRAIFFLFLGAIVNVVVAWAIASGTPNLTETAWGRAPLRDDEKGWVLETWFANRWEGFGSTSFVPSWVRMTINSPAAEGLLHPKDVLPDWPELVMPPEPFTRRASDHEMIVVTLRGWPARSMATGGRSESGGWAIPERH